MICNCDSLPRPIIDTVRNTRTLLIICTLRVIVYDTSALIGLCDTAHETGN